jgi:signal transduction histidine kinase
MNRLRVQFAIVFSVLFTIFFGIALTIIYFSYAGFRRDEFYSRLKDRALTTFRFLIEVDQIDRELLSVIDKNTLNSLYDEEVVIFKDTQMIYQSVSNNPVTYENLFGKARRRKVLYTTENDYEIVAIHIEQNGVSYIAIASAYDMFGRRKTQYLKWLIVIVYVVSLVIVSAVIYYFVKKIITPLDQLSKNIEQIDSENLHMRLAEHGQGHEVDKIASSFNSMLKRLHDSFRFQKDFVHYASHELRTPLTAMVSSTENALNDSLTEEEYRNVLIQLLKQQHDLTSITNSLLLLSDKKVDNLDYPVTRIDELVFRSVEIIRSMHPESQIEVNLEEVVPFEEYMSVRGNEPLLVMAFTNLLKNAIQYSANNAVIVTIRGSEYKKEVEFKNVGRNISEDEQRLLFTPFFRGKNAVYTKGYGLGLPLVKLIAEVNKADIQYVRDGDYNKFIFSFTGKRQTAGRIVRRETRDEKREP